MTPIDQHPSGAFCWIELGAADQQAGKEFYAGLFGWKVVDEPMGPDAYYTLFELEGRQVGAAYQLAAAEAGKPPNWMLYIAVADADAAAAKAAELGAKVHNQPFEVGPNGRMAVIEDPTGAMFCIWQPKSHKGIGLRGNGTLCWADLSTSDPARAAVFYESLFGWKLIVDEKDSSGYLHIQNGEHMIGGIPPTGHRNPNTPSHWLPYFAVASCSASAGTAEQLGARLILPPMTMPKVGTMSVIADPQGAVFALFEGNG